VSPNLSRGDSRPYDVLQRTLDKGCRQAEEPKQLVDEASQFYLGRQCQHSAVICFGALLLSSTVPQSSHAVLTQVRSMCSWSLPCALSVVPSILHLSHGFQCSPTLNRQPYKGRLPLTSWWRKSSNMTVGLFSLISLTHHCYDWHPGSCCGWSCNQLTSKVDGGVTGSRLRWSILTLCVIPQSGNRVSTSLGNSGLCWTVIAQNRDTAIPAEGNGDLQTLICVLVARLRGCSTLSNPVPWQNWTAAYLDYSLRMKTLFRGWPVMAHDMYTRRRRGELTN